MKLFPKEREIPGIRLGKMVGPSASICFFWKPSFPFIPLVLFGCPFITRLAAHRAYSFRREEAGTAPVRVVLVLLAALLPWFAAGCSPNSGDSGEPGLPLFDSATATARVAGSIMLEGPVSAPDPLKVVEDPFCQSSTQGVTTQEVLVAPGRKLENVIVYVRSGFEGWSYPVPAEPAVLDQQGCVYFPRVLTLQTNQKLRILNSDATSHNVHAQWGETSEFNVSQASKGVEDIQSFSHSGVPFRIGCDIHSWMVAYAGVFDHPFHTTSNDKGQYVLQLPPGQYEIVAWHEKFGEQVSTIAVADHSTLELDFTFLSEAE